MFAHEGLLQVFSLWSTKAGGLLLLPRLLEVLENQTSAAAPFIHYGTLTLSRAKCSWSPEKDVPSPGHLPALLRASARWKSQSTMVC